MVRVLVPIDGSPRDETALAEARRLTAEHPATVVLVGLGELADVPEHAAEERRALESLLATAGSDFGCEVVRVVEMAGDPAVGMLQAAADNAVDLIVLPTAAPDGHTNALPASIAQEVLRGAPVPVLVAGPPIQTPMISRALGTARRSAALVRRPPSSTSTAPSAAGARTPGVAPTSEYIDACALWVTLHRNEPHPSRRVQYRAEEPPLFLHFRHTGLMVGLTGDEHELQASPAGERTFELLDTDAVGLGLQPVDFEEGVALCGGAHEDASVGWHCEPITLVGVAAGGARVPLSDPSAIEDWLGA